MNNIFWPRIDDLWSAKKACIQASSVALIIAVVTGILTYMHLRGSTLIPGLDNSTFIDSVVFLILSIFIYRCSRIASLAAVCVYVYGQVVMSQELHRPPTSGILFTLLLIGGVRGAFSYHEMKKGLSAEEVKTTLKEQKDASTPYVSLPKRIAAWVVLIGLAAGVFWVYKNYSAQAGSKPQPPSIQPRSAPAIPHPPAIPQKMKAPSVFAPKPAAPHAPLPGEKVFKLKNGQTVIGKVVLDDPVYYTVETSSGAQEVVIKEDIAE